MSRAPTMPRSRCTPPHVRCAALRREISGAHPASDWEVYLYAVLIARFVLRAEQVQSKAADEAFFAQRVDAAIAGFAGGDPGQPRVGEARQPGECRRGAGRCGAGACLHLVLRLPLSPPPPEPPRAEADVSRSRRQPKPAASPSPPSPPPPKPPPPSPPPPIPPPPSPPPPTPPPPSPKMNASRQRPSS